MKNILSGLGLLAGLALAVSGCRETSKLPEPAIESLPLIFPEYSADPKKTFYNIDTARPAIGDLEPGETRPIFEFTINPKNDRAVKIRTVEVYKSIGSILSPGDTRNNRTPVPFGQSYTYGPRVKVGDYNSFPQKISLNSKQALTGLFYYTSGGASSLLVPAYPALPNGDYDDNTVANYLTSDRAIIFTFEYVLEDGRRIVLTPLDSRGTITGTFITPPYAALALFKVAQ